MINYLHDFIFAIVELFSHPFPLFLLGVAVGVSMIALIPTHTEEEADE